MIKQNKGKDLYKIPRSKLDTKGPYYCSKKFDGNYVQIIYDGRTTQFYTSGGKQFYLIDMAKYIQHHFKFPFHIECEYLYGCEGKLGDRGKSAKLTTYRTEFRKGNPTFGNHSKDIFIILDRLDQPLNNFEERLATIRYTFHDTEWFIVPKQILCDLDTGINTSRIYYSEGYEGAMLKHVKHMYKPGKRVNDIIKLKPRKTEDLIIIDWQNGTGKYEGMVGAYLLRDADGLEVWVGSGLSDEQRREDPVLNHGRIVEIEYERIDDTYVQPIFKRFRDDKDTL